MLNIEKLSYSIGQVSELTEIAQSTLRYWETVIMTLSPHKTEGGSRRYSKADVEIVLSIKDLLYNQGFTIKGANLFLKKNNDELPQIESTQFETETSDYSRKIDITDAQNSQKDLKYVVDELKKIKTILEK